MGCFYRFHHYAVYVFCHLLLLALLINSLTIQNHLLIRQIQQSANVIDAMKLLHHSSTAHDAPFLQALRSCAKHQDYVSALEIYNQHPSESCKPMVISILGQCGQLEQVEGLLTDDSSVASFNAAIAACGKDYKLALAIYKRCVINTTMTTTDNSSPITTHALLTVLARCKQGLLALDAYESQLVPASHRDARSLELVVRALVRSNQVQEAATLVNAHDASLHTSAATAMIVAAHHKRNQWEEARAFLQQTVDNNNSTSSITKQQQQQLQQQQPFEHWTDLVKVGHGKRSYWEIGTFEQFTIGLHPHRNPGQNGMQVELFANKREKLGFLLMKNDADDESSSLLGIKVMVNRRGQGLSKVLLAIWMHYCLQAGLLPKTGIMNKPVLCLVLQYAFQFKPRKGGVQVEVTPGSDGSSVLYSAQKGLAGVFTPCYVKSQNITIAKDAPNPRGRIIHVRAHMDAPSTRVLRECVASILKDGLQCTLESDAIKTIFLGQSA
jgi:hypothetical protein